MVYPQRPGTDAVIIKSPEIEGGSEIKTSKPPVILPGMQTRHQDMKTTDYEPEMTPL